MRRLAVSGVLLGTLWGALSGATAASAATWCVRDPACPAGASKSQSTIQGAVNLAGANDTILIGPGRFSETVVAPPSTPLTIIGAGATKTIIQSPAAAPTTSLSFGAGFLEDVGVELGSGTNNIGLALGGTARGIVVTAPAGTSSGTGVLFVGGGLQQSTISLAVGGGSTTVGAGLSPLVLAGGLIADSTITAATGADQISELERDKIRATVGFAGTQSPGNGAGQYTIDNTLIDTVAGAMPEAGMAFGVAPDATSNAAISAACSCDHLTIVGSGSAGSVGIDADGTSSGSQTAFDLIAVDESIIRGYATSLSRSASGPSSALVSISLRYSDADTGSARSANSGSGSGSIGADFTDINADPQFVSTSFGASNAFELKVPSPAIDAGFPVERAGESPIDAAGQPRVVAGRNTANAVADMGAFEYQPHAPTAVEHAPATTFVGGQTRFSAAGSADVDPGDTLTYTWRFSDGATATGVVVRHAFKKIGKYRARLTVSDFNGRTATAVARVAVLSAIPRITDFKLSPGIFRVSARGKTVVPAATSAGTTVSYDDTLGAKTKFRVLRRRGRHYVVVGKFTHHDRAGHNRFRFTGRFGRFVLNLGRYRLQAVPHADGHKGKRVFRGFIIIP
jgi:hypothetical protein